MVKVAVAEGQQNEISGDRRRIESGSRGGRAAVKGDCGLDLDVGVRAPLIFLLGIGITVDNRADPV